MFQVIKSPPPSPSSLLSVASNCNGRAIWKHILITPLHHPLNGRLYRKLSDPRRYTWRTCTPHPRTCSVSPIQNRTVFVDGTGMSDMAASETGGGSEAAGDESEGYGDEEDGDSDSGSGSGGVSGSEADDEDEGAGATAFPPVPAWLTLHFKGRTVLTRTPLPTL
jgi:hypothetical protein